MEQRLRSIVKYEDAYKAASAIENYVNSNGLEHSLVLLVKMRASQINGCAYCLHMHSLDARKEGETEARLYLLDAWRESNLYTPRERAALAWTEALTLVSKTHVPDEVFNEVKRQFSEEEMVALSLAIGAINTWNRISIGFRLQHPADKIQKAA